MRQLNLEVSSFLSDPFYTFENRLLPNDVILLRNIGGVMSNLEKDINVEETSKDDQHKLEAQSN